MTSPFKIYCRAMHLNPPVAPVEMLRMLIQAVKHSDYSEQLQAYNAMNVKQGKWWRRAKSAFPGQTKVTKQNNISMC